MRPLTGNSPITSRGIARRMGQSGRRMPHPKPAPLASSRIVKAREIAERNATDPKVGMQTAMAAAMAVSGFLGRMFGRRGG